VVQFEKAVAYVRLHGTDVERARLDYLLTGREPSDTTARTLFLGQRPDGGWSPFWAPDYSSLDATCYRLAQADQLGLTGQEPAERALRFLAARQGADGNWEEDWSVRDLSPPWARPGDPACQLYLTANCGYWLAILRGDAEAVGRATRYLADHRADDGSLPTFPHAHWLAAGLWYWRGDRNDADAVLANLAMRVPTLAAGNLGWLVVTLQRAGVPADRPLVKQARARLEAEQQPDGRWVSEDGPGRDVHATLEALQALGYGTAAKTPDRGASA
jgi:hypothetical protein